MSMSTKPKNKELVRVLVEELAEVYRHESVLAAERARIDADLNNVRAELGSVVTRKSNLMAALCSYVSDHTAAGLINDRIRLLNAAEAIHIGKADTDDQ